MIRFLLAAMLLVMPLSTLSAAPKGGKNLTPRVEALEETVAAHDAAIAQIIFDIQVLKQGALNTTQALITLNARVDELADTAILPTETRLPGASPLPAPDKTIKVACGALGTAINQAVIDANSGLNVQVILPACTFREEMNISNVGAGSIDIVAGAAVISGSDIFTGWAQDVDGIWSTAWPYDFGLRWPTNWPLSLPQDEILKRIETFFVDGIRLTQVVAYTDLVDESFFIDEPGDKVFIKSAIDLTAALVEGTVRQTLIRLHSAENIAIRNILVQHAASDIQNGTGVRIANSSNILLEDMVIRDNSGIGLSIVLSEFITTRRTQFLDNGYNGYTAWRVAGLLSEDDTVSGSNWRGFPFGMTGWGIAGFKHLGIHDAVYRRLTATANLTRGFWLDYDIANIVIEDSRWCDNSTQGAFLEKIQGPLLIRGLTVCNNSGGGILVSAARNITVEDSQFENNGREQIHFSGTETVNVTDFETAEQFVVSTDFWVVTKSSLSAFGDQTILSGPFLPLNFTASGNTCSTGSPTVDDALVC